MHQQSAPTWDFGAPDIPVLPPNRPPSARGRCAKCALPIWDGEAAHHTRVLSSTCRAAIPYEHEECTV